MLINHAWKIYQTQGYDAVKRIVPQTARDAFYLAVLAFGEQKFEDAFIYLRNALKDEPENTLLKNASSYLKRVTQSGTHQVYATGEGFAAFIRAGGNLPLYTQTSAALREIYQEYQRISLLDIGAGDGRALLPALTENIARLDLLEPSAPMLAALQAELDRRKRAYQATCRTVQEFIAAPTDDVWDVIEATFSLHALDPQERPTVLQWIRKHGTRMLLVEFDAPAASEMYDPQWVTYIFERYREGLAEYPDDDGTVAQGFLMPVLFGNFDRTTARMTYEQPIQAWVDELSTAGFERVTLQPLYSYWWATAYLIDAR